MRILDYSEIVLGSTENTSSGNCAPPQVQKIQYQEPNSQTFTDITGTLYILKDTTVTFKAVPQNSRFPSGQPVWSGTSGATGTGKTKSVSFNTTSSSLTNYQTVTATSGNNPVTVNVIVYELTVTVTPEDNAGGRSLIKCGLEEVFGFAFTASPAVTATQAGGLRWSVQTGTGNIPANRIDGIGLFTAPKTAESSVLRLEVLDGPSKGSGITYNIEIVAPDDGFITKYSNIWRGHIGGFGGSFKAYFYLKPRNVSFYNIKFSEGAVNPVTSGWLSFFSAFPHPASQTQAGINACNSQDGCNKVAGDDTITNYDPPPIHSPNPMTGYVGQAEWAIPWLYHTTGSTSGTVFKTVNHHCSSDSMGTATIEKAGAGPYTIHLNDPASNY